MRGASCIVSENEDYGSTATLPCNTPHRRHKTWVHEGGISTPLIAHWPQGITARDELQHTPAHVIVFVPTVLELAGIQPALVRE